MAAVQISSLILPFGGISETSHDLLHVERSKPWSKPLDSTQCNLYVEFAPWQSVGEFVLVVPLRWSSKANKKRHPSSQVVVCLRLGIQLSQDLGIEDLGRGNY